MLPATQPAQSPLTLVRLSSPDVNTPPHERHLTVSPRRLTRTHTEIEAPEIRLTGVYLQKLGFTIGSKVTVIEKPGELIVRLDGNPAQHDPNETADDRRYARKLKRVTDYQQTTQLPLSDGCISQYLSGEMPYYMQELVSRVIDGEVPEPYQTAIHQFLTGNRNPHREKPEAQFFLGLIDQHPKPKRKRTVRQTKPSAMPAENSQTNPISLIPTTAPTQNNRIQLPPEMQVAELSHHQAPNPGSKHITNVLQSLKCPPPPDPVAGLSMREQLESLSPLTKPQTHYAEIPPRLRENFTADELKIHDACRPENSPVKVDR